MNILFATDHSPTSTAAMELIEQMFARSAHVHVFSVVSNTAETGWANLPDVEQLRFDERLGKVEAAVRDTAARFARAGFSSTWGVQRGTAGHQLVEETRKGAYDLVVMGGRHTTKAGNLMLGSVSMRVLHQSPVPVLVVHQAPHPHNRVILATDGSPLATQAIGFALKILDMHRCTFEVVSVVPDPLALTVPTPGFLAGVPVDHRVMDTRLVDESWELVDAQVAAIESAGGSAFGTVLVGHAGYQLRQEAERTGASLVIAGSRGIGPFGRLTMGSVSDNLVHHASATMVVRCVAGERSVSDATMAMS